MTAYTPGGAAPDLNLRIAELERAVAEYRDRLGACICDHNPTTTDGPDEWCPQHGRPISDWADYMNRIGSENATLRASLAGRGVLGEVAAERMRQDDTWGEQNHPDGTGPDHIPGAVERAEASKKRTDRRARKGTVTYADILTEEFDEAMAEEHPAALRTELLQVAAVAVAWVEKIDRAARIEGAES